MATKAEDILKRVQALGYGTDTEASQLLTLNTLHKRVTNQRRWEFMRGQAAKSMTIGQGTYSLSEFGSDVKHVDAVRIGITSTSDFPEIEALDYDNFRDLEHTYRDNGTPRYWTQSGKTIRFWPTPDKAYSITLDYIKSPTEITAAGSEVQIPDSHADILAWGTIMGLTFRERDWEGHNFARQMYSELLAEMMAQYGMTDRQTPKHVESSGFFDGFDPEAEWLI